MTKSLSITQNNLALDELLVVRPSGRGYSFDRKIRVVSMGNRHWSFATRFPGRFCGQYAAKQNSFIGVGTRNNFENSFN